jgi:release factor glutamine methyltransferase
VREYEPDEALFAGESGLEAYRVLAPELPRLLNPEGFTAVEIGHDQAKSVKPLLTATGLSATVAKDIADRPRALLLTWN